MSIVTIFYSNLAVSETQSLLSSDWDWNGEIIEPEIVESETLWILISNNKLTKSQGRTSPVHFKQWSCTENLNTVKYIFFLVICYQMRLINVHGRVIILQLHIFRGVQLVIIFIWGPLHHWQINRTFGRTTTVKTFSERWKIAARWLYFSRQ